MFRPLFCAISLFGLALGFSGLELAQYEAALETYETKKATAEQAAEAALADGEVDQEERERVVREWDQARRARAELTQRRARLVESPLD